jgi:hypothetical protein
MGGVALKAIKTGFLCVLAASSFALPAGAMQNEPAHFLGIEWGAPIDRYRAELKPIFEDGDTGHYRRPSDRPYFAGVEVRRISYHFFKGNFASGMYVTVGSNDLRNILAHLTSVYGEPSFTHARHRIYSWEGERSAVMVTCDISISCYTEFYDKTVREAAMQARGEPRRAD